MTKVETEKIYAEYKEKVERYISGKVRNLCDAEDLVSSVFPSLLAQDAKVTFTLPFL